MKEVIDSYNAPSKP